MLIYKLLLPAEWEEFEAEGRFVGSPLDRDDGFVHCSSRTQLGATAQRVFAPDQELVVLAIDTEALGNTVRWEPASTGGLFPHVYAAVPRDSVTAVYRVGGPAAVEGVLPPQ